MTRYNNRRMGWIVKVALALFVLFGTNQSYAACEQSNLTGTWFFNGLSGDLLLNDWETDFCKIKVNSTGTILNSGSQCKFRTTDGKDSIDVQGGNLAIRSNCSIKGKITVCDSGFCGNLVIDNARLDKGKTVITLVGRASFDPDVVVFYTGVKR